MKAPWTPAGLEAAAESPCEPFITYPTSGNMWVRKYRTVLDLVRHVQRSPVASMTDDEVYASLRTIDGVGL